jgi:hypothetical protein
MGAGSLRGFQATGLEWPDIIGEHPCEPMRLDVPQPQCAPASRVRRLRHGDLYVGTVGEQPLLAYPQGARTQYPRSPSAAVTHADATTRRPRLKASQMAPVS